MQSKVYPRKYHLGTTFQPSTPNPRIFPLEWIVDAKFNQIKLHLVSFVLSPYALQIIKVYQAYIPVYVYPTQKMNWVVIL